MMCGKSDAANARSAAANGLLQVCQARFGLGPALRAALPLPPTTDEWTNYLKLLDRAEAR